MNITDMILLERHRNTCNWIPTYGFVGQLARTIGANRLCEVGVAYGYHAEHILDNMPEIEYFGIDPYLAGYDPSDPFVRDVAKLYADDPQLALNRLFSSVNCKLTKYDGRANLIRKKSVTGAEIMRDGYFDIIYIDGDHTYDAVCEDLKAWYSKVRPGGIICGDDFGWEGVRKAVLEFMGPRNKLVIEYRSANSDFPEKWSVAV
jgi:predicted O-methyltransferase YrrM